MFWRAQGAIAQGYDSISKKQLVLVKTAHEKQKQQKAVVVFIVEILILDKLCDVVV